MNVLGILRGLAGLLILLGIMPVGIGGLFAGMIKRLGKSNLFFCYMLGFMTVLAVSEVLSVPMTILKCDFRLFVGVYSILLAVLFFTGCTVGRTQIRLLAQETFARIKQTDRYDVLVLAVVFVPVVVLLFYTPYIYGDDKTYIALVNDILTSNRLYLTDVATGGDWTRLNAKYALSSYWTWVAYIAKITGIHPLILCKTVMGILYVPMGYAVQRLLAGFLFSGEKRKIHIFMILVVLASLFGGFSGYTVTFRIYTWVWQSKALLAIIVLPFLMYYCNLIYTTNAGFGEYFLLFLMNIAVCSTSLTGAGLAVVVECVTALIYSVGRKKIMILGKTLPTCIPALVLMLVYIQFRNILEMIHFYE
jgi:hypothetical protein